MSQRTIVEFNHDFGHKIEDDPEGFVDAVCDMIRSGAGSRTVQDRLRSFGVQTTPTMHHSDERVLKTRHAQYRF